MLGVRLFNGPGLAATRPVRCGQPDSSSPGGGRCARLGLQRPFVAARPVFLPSFAALIPPGAAQLIGFRIELAPVSTGHLA